jgi:hypothetical protein
MSALLSADAPLTEEERNDLLAQEQALKKQLRQVRAKLGQKSRPHPQLMETFNRTPNPNATSTTDIEPPTAEELKPSDAEIEYFRREELCLSAQRSTKDDLVQDILLGQDWKSFAKTLLCSDDISGYVTQENNFNKYMSKKVKIKGNDHFLIDCVFEFLLTLGDDTETKWSTNNRILTRLLKDLPKYTNKKGDRRNLSPKSALMLKLTCAQYYVAFDTKEFRRLAVEENKVCFKMFFLSHFVFAR